jgi:hypothetical protein
MLDRIERKGVEVAETDDPSFGLDDRQAPGRFTLGSCCSHPCSIGQSRVGHEGSWDRSTADPPWI